MTLNYTLTPKDDTQAQTRVDSPTKNKK